MVIFFSSLFNTYIKIIMDISDSQSMKIKVIVLMSKLYLLCSRPLYTIRKENLSTLKGVCWKPWIHSPWFIMAAGVSVAWIWTRGSLTTALVHLPFVSPSASSTQHASLLWPEVPMQVAGILFTAMLTVWDPSASCCPGARDGTAHPADSCQHTGVTRSWDGAVWESAH